MDNRRGIFLMVAAMLAFALEDMFIKIMSSDLGVGQILASLGIMGGVVYGIICKVQGLPCWRGPCGAVRFCYATSAKSLGPAAFSWR